MAHEHSVYDSDKHFRIDPATREIINESGKIVLIQHDHNSERFTFEIPKEVDGHDMSLCNVVQIHYLNIEKGSGITHTEYEGLYEADDLQASPTSNDVVICSWLLSRNATQYVGSLNFVVRFACVSDDGTIDYDWSTAIHSGIAISDGIRNTEVVAEEYADVLEQWRQELILANIAEQYTPEEARAAFEVCKVEQRTATLFVNAWVDNQQTVNVEYVTADNAVFVSPAPDSFDAYGENGIRCTAQAAGTLTFRCDTIPAETITVNVVVMA